MPGTSRIALSPAALSGTIQPNGTAAFQLIVNNSGLVTDHVTLAGVDKNPPAWLYNFTPSSLDINANDQRNVTLVIYAPTDVVAGSNVTLSFVASDSLGTSNVVRVALDVVSPPPAPAPPSAPKLALSIAPAAGPVGGSAQGSLTLTDADTTDITVRLAASSPHAWAVSFPAGSERNTHPNVPVSVPLTAVIPSGTAPGTVEPVTITASVGGFSFQVTWNVTALAPAAGSPQDAAPTSGGGAAPSAAPGTGTTPASSAPKTESYALSVSVLPSTVQVAPGESASAKVRLYNTGTKPLHLALLGNAADNWPLTFEPRTVDLPVGDIIDVQMTLSAPADIFPGGSGSGSVMVQGDSGLLRTSTFKLQIIAAATPRDTSKAAAATTLPPVTSPNFSLSPTATGLAIGLGAVGTGALVLARRPAREKLLWLGIGLYTRLARPDVLGHPERERLYRIVETQPGVHFHALQRELQWNTGTLTYHLRVLEKHGFIVDRRDGSFRRFYIQGAAPKKELFNPDAPQGLRADVIEAIRSRHGISQSDLALALGANKQTVNYHVKALERTGVIRVEKRGRDTFLYPTNAPGMGPGEVPA